MPCVGRRWTDDYMLISFVKKKSFFAFGGKEVMVWAYRITVSFCGFMHQKKKRFCKEILETGNCPHFACILHEYVPKMYHMGTRLWVLMLNRNIKFWVCLECKIHYVQEYLYLKSGVYYQHSIFFSPAWLMWFQKW